jgi:hypothetical protein
MRLETANTCSEGYLGPGCGRSDGFEAKETPMNFAKERHFNVNASAANVPDTATIGLCQFLLSSNY